MTRVTLTAIYTRDLMRKILTNIKLLCLFTACLIVSNFSFATPNIISIEQVKKDVADLASDQLKGRGNFSPEIKQAADYIAKRFIESGLSKDSEISSQGLLQNFKVTKTSPKALKILLNGKVLLPENSAMISTFKNISMDISNGNKSSEFTIHNISKNDNVRTTLSNINQLGGKHFVLLNPIHKVLFKRFKQYFNNGVTRLNADSIKNQGGSIVIVLSDLTTSEIKTLSVSGISSVKQHELTNVVGVIPGKKAPEEIVLFSAHYDHLGMTSNNKDSIFNGANDNASGTAAIINIAQYYAKQGNNARTLMFAAFSAEEIGGFGSKYFSIHINPKSVTAMINIEMIGKPSKFGAGTLWMTGMERSNLGNQLNSTLSKFGQKIFKDPYPDQGLFYRSDNARLARLGVPAHTFSSAQLTNDKDYHKVSDELASLNIPSLHKAIESLIIATKPLVNRKVTPSRIDVNKLTTKGKIY